MILVILTIRTWALWESNRRLGVLLAVLFAITWITIFMLLQKRSLSILQRELHVNLSLHAMSLLMAHVVTDIPNKVFQSGSSATSTSPPLSIVWGLLIGFQLGMYFES